MIDAGTSQPTSKAQTADSYKTTLKHLKTSHIGSTGVETTHAKVQSQINPEIDALIDAMTKKLGEKQVTRKNKSSARRNFCAGSSKKKKKAEAVMVDPAKVAGNKKERKGRAEAAHEMAKRIAAECMSTDPSQHIPTPDATSDAETKVQVLRLKIRQQKKRLYYKRRYVVELAHSQEFYNAFAAKHIDEC